jgi:BlaI family penicillinase repressor
VKPDPRLADADWKVMDVLWRRQLATAREVHDALAHDTGWAYTTVKTMLDRLAEKGLVEKALEGDLAALEVESPAGRRAATYRANLTRSQARLQAARGLAERAFGGAMTPLVHFLLESEPLSDADRAELLEKLERERDRRRRERDTT